MHEKELRLGVILTGGISLAVYMHGVTRELLKLTRASRSFHMRDETGGRVPEGYRDTAPDREVDTEAVYFDLLKELAPDLDLRVVIDVIAGASAGGVNGIMLARALAHDLDIDPLRQMWLENADVLHLVEQKASASRWSKFYVRPVVALAMRGALGTMAPEPETREKLSFFLRSRWFQPPFSGPAYVAWLLDACTAMDRHAPDNGTLLPSGHGLDLFVSVTDFFGHTNRIALHDPTEIKEQDHRHVLHFGFEHAPDGDITSDFRTNCAPGLVFAARATSCFPGAFPPASLGEIDKVAKIRDLTWADRDAFIAEKLKGLHGLHREAGQIRFIDGSVVNDKPFGAAIAAVTGRPAHRHVTRRLVYVEPNPVDNEEQAETGEPGFFRTILSSLAEIPRNEPIHDELARINEFNAQIRLLRQVMEEVQPFVERFVERILPPSEDELRPTQEQVSKWRSAANEQAAIEAGYAFHSYFRLKVLKVAQRLETLTGSVIRPPHHAFAEEPEKPGFFQALLRLGARGVTGNNRDADPAGPSEIAFLKKFDVDFRVRRLRFVIRQLNELYQAALSSPKIESRTEWLDELKATLYGQLAEVRKRWDPQFYPPDIAASFHAPPAHIEDDKDAYTEMISRMGDAMGLETLDAAIDEVFAVMVLNYVPPELRRKLFTAFLGFSFFDVLSFPMMQWEDLDEFEEILIDRISPVDARAIRQGGPAEMLRGTAMRRFGGFFNRSYRENDYLWGRLNAADRLVDIILGAVGDRANIGAKQVLSIKKRLFLAILDAETGFLQADPALLKKIREEVLAMP